MSGEIEILCALRIEIRNLHDISISRQSDSPVFSVGSEARRHHLWGDMNQNHELTLQMAEIDVQSQADHEHLKALVLHQRVD